MIERGSELADEKIPLAVVLGPTASGKTALAVDLALRFGGEIVSADSMQIYKGMNIATAKPTPAEMRGVPHHLMDFLDPSEGFSVADYAALAHQTIREIRSRQRLPILAGGTGLYIDAVVNNISFAEIKTDPRLREELMQLAQQKGAVYLLNELKGFDPDTAAKLHPNNLPRIIRAIEVYRLTGVTMAEHQRRSKMNPTPYRSVLIGLGFRDRQKLYERIDARVDRMLENGLLEEARTVLQKKGLKTAAQAIGYKELKRYFDGEESLAEAAEKIRQESRRYAKRQLTWFRKNTSVSWLYVDDYQNMEELAENAAEKLKNLL